MGELGELDRVERWWYAAKSNSDNVMPEATTRIGSVPRSTKQQVFIRRYLAHPSDAPPQDVQEVVVSRRAVFLHPLSVPPITTITSETVSKYDRKQQLQLRYLLLLEEEEIVNRHRLRNRYP